MNDTLGARASVLTVVPNRPVLAGLARSRGKVVAVVGPEHSGTSLCAYALSLLGVDMRDPPTAAAPVSANGAIPTFSWEREPIKSYHDRILQLFNRDQAGPLYSFALPVAWWADPRVTAIRREMSLALEDRLDGGYFGFADPCTIRLLPLWQQIFSELKLTAKIVLCLRNPALTAGSPQSGSRLDPSLAEYRWFVQVTDFFRYADRLDHCVLEYEDWLNDASLNLEKLQTFLGLEWQQSDADRELVLSRITTLAETAAEARAEPRHPIVRKFYDLARRSSGGAQDLGGREQIVREFIAFQQLQRPIEDALAAVQRERDAYLADRDVLGAELAATRAMLGERDAALARAQAEAATAAAALTESQAAQAALEADRAAQDRANEMLKTRLNEAETMLAATRSERDDARAALEKSEAAREALRRLIATTREELERTSEMHTALQQAQQRREAETAGLRQQLGTSEHEAARQREEIAALRGALRAARQAGGAAIQALARLSVPPPPSRPGWVEAMKRRFGFVAR